MPNDGTSDIAQAIDSLAARLPVSLAPLAMLAYNYWWSWQSHDGDELFRPIDPWRWEHRFGNPVRLLQEADSRDLLRVAADADYVRRVHDTALALGRYLEDGHAGGAKDPVVYLSAEVGIHESLPVYAGGLGVLMGDLLKEASDQALPAAGVSLLYSQGYFHQRLDASGWQHEFWLDSDARRLPGARVTGEDGRPLSFNVSLAGREVVVHIWRVNIGRVPLFLLDTNHGVNRPVDRWITSRLYISDREYRLLQYALLGIGSVRALQAMGITPALYHLNEGHAALASFELLRQAVDGGASLDDALASVRAGTTFTTHTPVPAGHDVFSHEQLAAALPHLPEQQPRHWQTLLDLGQGPRAEGAFGTTQFALRTSGSYNGVSRRHGEVTRAMWHGLWPHEPVERVPIGHVTNGVHLPTWMAPEMLALLDRYLPSGWRDDPAAWKAVEDIPDAELWAVRSALRRHLVGYVRRTSVVDRLGRGESAEYAASASDIWDENTLTLGFARRIATYKRLHLLTVNPERGLRLLDGPHPLQLAIAGKAHPQDDDAKRSVQQIFGLNRIPVVAGRAVFLEDQSMLTETYLIRGSDLWINLPRPPQEASGTSGMKSMLNGGLQLSVLDGWWAEAYDGSNGWGVEGEEEWDHARQDHDDAEALYRLLETEIVPLFYDKGEDGVPHGWVRYMKASLRTLGYQFSARRMVRDYYARYRGNGLTV